MVSGVTEQAEHNNDATAAASDMIKSIGEAAIQCEDMMQELKNIKKETEIYQTILVVDAMTGQDAVNVASTFDNEIGVDGVILTKVDGDTRGGAALSIRQITNKW